MKFLSHRLKNCVIRRFYPKRNIV
ncbi:hypothetical protein KUCAC02_007641 [Chaenocephalus aceratus]|uniref:Uncharacterized protein n=1 Tax=Chaenocephalus aceratus TaxID=36190 RepID=A0ACB9X717_CHAAC|nr:hypothetical protein KUCAC02_007641 [Chaenocephalus aceratus]